MLEVLVALVIVAFGMLGLLGLQARALTFQKDSFDGRAAAELANQMTDRIRANMIGFRDRAYNVSLNPGAPLLAFGACATPGDCTGPEVAQRDLAHWHTEAARRLPGVALYLAPDNAVPANAPRFVTVSIAWPEPGQAAGSALALADPACDDIRAGPFPGLPAEYRCYRTSVAP